MRHIRSANTDKYGVAGRAFRRAAAGLTLFAAGCASVPLPPPVAPDCTGKSLKIVFENKAAPVLLGARMQGIFNDNDSEEAAKVAQYFYEALGRHEMLMRVPGNAETFERWTAARVGRGAGAAATMARIETVVGREFKWQQEARKLYMDAPMETLAAGEGDCKGLTFLMYAMARSSGIPADRLYIVLVDNAKGEPGTHMLLLADVRPGDAPASKADFRIYRSRSRPATPTDVDMEPAQRTAYKVYYAMNETGVWFAPAHFVPEWGAPRPQPDGCAAPRPK
jgi:hypothetical protein